MIALLSLWIISILPLSSDGHSEQEVQNRQAWNFGLLGLAAVFAIAWFARVREIRRKGESILWIERQTWGRGEAISGSIDLGFGDPVVDAEIHLAQRRDFGEAFPWSRVANHAQSRQLLSFRGTVSIDAPDSSFYMLVVRMRTMSGMRTTSAFPLTVHGGTRFRYGDSLRVTTGGVTQNHQVEKGDALGVLFRKITLCVGRQPPNRGRPVLLPAKAGARSGHRSTKRARSTSS